MKDQKRDLKIVGWPVTVSVFMHVRMQILRCGSQVLSQDATARSAVAILYVYIYIYIYSPAPTGPPGCGAFGSMLVGL